MEGMHTDSRFKGLIPYISLEQFFLWLLLGVRVILGFKISVESLQCNGYLLWVNRQNLR